MAGRKPRAKKDIINLLLDIGYTKLFHFIEALLLLYGFDVYKGVYHCLFYQRKSLVCDLVEPFRPLIDNRIRTAFNRGEINENDFDLIHDQYRLLGKNAQPYVALLLEVILKNKDEIFIYIQQYYRAFIQGKKIEDYPVFIGNDKC